MKPRARASAWWWGVAALSLVGLGLSSYLSIVYLAGHAPACGPVVGCEEVTSSAYARFLGVPVAFLGVAGYGVLLMGALTCVSIQPAPALARRGMLAVALGGVAFSVYLTAVQRFVVHAFCVYCLASASVMTAILALTVAALWAGRTGGGDASRASP